MTLIEGIGDEVTQFFGFLILLLLGLFAWWSTGISELPPIRTVLIFESRAQSNVSAQRQSLVTNQPERNSSDPPPNRNFASENLPTPKNETPIPSATVAPGAAPVADESLGTEEAAAESVQTGDNASCVEEDNAAVENSAPSTDLTEQANESSEMSGEGEQEHNVQSDDPEQDVDNIRIRLKYLNDDQKLVRGKLHELLGDFKRRNFSVELSREKRVRLIFNGQVLQRDEQTLQGCGLYDNCVVHCLVHQQQHVNRPPTQQATHVNASPPEWNLGGLLYVSLSIIIGFAWFLRYHYAQLFTLTTTTALTGLTAMFAVSIIGMYMPDHEAPPA
uniref:Transmembrane and ubiquitin-like domain-containing protein 1 n=1 Tax=Lygus hesperus TaxID=30085 RepID=A0A0A9YWL6_LYGHE